MKVSVIIPNYNGKNYIEKCLDSLVDMKFKEYELIIVDNASTDGSLEIIKERSEPITLIENRLNMGFSVAINQGIRVTSGKYVALLNNDIEVDREWLGNLYDAIELDELVFAVSSKMIRYFDRNTIDDVGDGYTILGWAFKKGDGQSIDGHQKKKDVFSACAGAAIYRKSVLNEIGLFDENFFAYLEDIDLSYRARIYGYKSLFDPLSIVYHIGSATSGSKYNEFKINLSSRNNMFVLYKNMPLLQLIINGPFILVGEIIKTVFFIKKGYGIVYLKSKYQGYIMRTKLIKTPRQRFVNYLRIEWLLIKDTCEYIYYSLAKLFSK